MQWLFQVDFAKLRNYLWYSREKQWCLLEVGINRTAKRFGFAENLGNIPENPRENGAQGLQKIAWTPFLVVTPKKVFMIFVGERF